MNLWRCGFLLLPVWILLADAGLGMSTLHERAINVVEPSGIVRVGSTYYVISDTKFGNDPRNKIYALDQSGNVVRTHYAGDRVGNFEGITHDGTRFYVIAEHGTIYVYDNSFALERSFTLSDAVLSYVVDHRKAGFESITHDGKHLYVATEKGPKYLIKIDPNGNEVTKWDLSELGFRDISDVTYAIGKDGAPWFFVASHESEAIAGFPASSLKIETRGSPIQPEYFQRIVGLKQIEGIAFNGTHFVLVSDKDGKWASVAY